MCCGIKEKIKKKLLKILLQKILLSKKIHYQGQIDLYS